MPKEEEKVLHNPASKGDEKKDGEDKKDGEKKGAKEKKDDEKKEAKEKKEETKEKIRIEDDGKTEIIIIEKPKLKEPQKKEEAPFIFHKQDEHNRPIEKSKLEKEIETIIDKSEISLILDTYDDIFSDFDPRPYSIRGLSDDFINEAKKALRETKPDVFELKFLIPEMQRRPGQEPLIKKRLKDYFKKQLMMLEKEMKSVRKNGVKLAIIGFILMISAALLYTLNSGSNQLWIQLLVIPIEPAGWFFVWEGFERIFNYTKEKKPDIEFYKKMNKAEISFITY